MRVNQPITKRRLEVTEKSKNKILKVIEIIMR